MEHHASLQLTTPGSRYSARQRTGLALIGVGVLALLVMLVGDGSLNPALTMGVAMVGFLVGSGLLFADLLQQAP
ncbi:MAG: hypothetical protein F4146_03465, partial [Rhodothermaceae bacterium]|nr:hypothetical protein [Rhodothermaceae bacterium]